jgi:glycosyltransferase involved in cell wall biosynthesis
MRLLLLAAASPEPARSGQRLRYRQHVEGLRQAGVEVGLVSFARDAADEAGIARLGRSLSFVRGVPGGNRSTLSSLRALAAGEPFHLGIHGGAPFERALDEALARFAPEVVVAGNGYLAQHLARVPADRLRVVDEQNDEVEVWELEATHHPSPLRRLEAAWNRKRLLEAEPALLAAADLTLAVSEEDRIRFEARGRQPVEVAPNGVDRARYAESAGIERDPDELIFTGTDAERNLDALRWFLGEIWPQILSARPSTRLVVAGSFGPSSQRALRPPPSVSFTGPLPDIVPSLRRASLFVAPFRLGGGTKLKILEAGAAGLAVVSTAVGTRGLGLETGIDHAEAADAPSFAKEVVRLLASPATRLSLASALEEVVRTRYDQPVLGRRLAALLARALEAKRARSSRRG